MSELVFDITAVGMYIKAAISSLGVHNNDLAINVAARLKEQIIRTNTIPWPPDTHELEREEDLSELMVKL